MIYKYSNDHRAPLDLGEQFAEQNLLHILAYYNRMAIYAQLVMVLPSYHEFFQSGQSIRVYLISMDFVNFFAL